jgi:RNA polymerase sigma-70 factor (ECF subfamily)
VEPNPKQNQEVSDLVQQAISGSESAFGRIYDIYYDRVYRFVFYRVNHKEIAEDLVAETFIRIWKKISEIQEAAAFQGWMYQIARNLVIDHYRSRKADTDIFEKTNLGFQQREFLEALKQLSDEQQLVIKLKFLDDLDNKEISQILEKSEGAIRVIQHRAIAELKTLIDKHEHD